MSTTPRPLTADFLYARDRVIAVRRNLGDLLDAEAVPMFPGNVKLRNRFEGWTWWRLLSLSRKEVERLPGVGKKFFREVEECIGVDPWAF